MTIIFGIRFPCSHIHMHGVGQACQKTPIKANTYILSANRGITLYGLESTRKEVNLHVYLTFLSLYMLK